MTTPNSSDVQYFKVNFDSKFYFPITRNQRWTVLARLNLGYGNGYGDVNGNDQLLPFWENFRAGGSDTLRGFESNTVGPRAVYRYPTQEGIVFLISMLERLNLLTDKGEVNLITHCTLYFRINNTRQTPLDVISYFLNCYVSEIIIRGF